MKRSLKIVRRLSFKNPLTGRQHSAKETRSHSSVVRTFASGGRVPSGSGSDLSPWSSAAVKPAKTKKRYRSVGKHGGSLASTRLDKSPRNLKRAFGGPVGLPVQANPAASAALAARPMLPSQAQGVRPFAFGGPVMHQFTPSKHKPHTSVHITNISRGGGGGGGAGLPRSPLGLAGPGLPGPGGPGVMPPPMGFERGGVVGTVRDLGRVSDMCLSGKGSPYSAAAKKK